MNPDKKAIAAGSMPFIGSDRLLLYGYAATVFLGAALLFAVQPMVSKMLLPHLGGSPSVWNTCMVFFQATLLLGYLYAHLIAQRFGGGAQAAIHGTVLAAAALFVPLDLMTPVPPAEGTPVPWLLGTLAATVGLPFFAVSATAPLLQRWFSRTDHPAASDPYFLYAASNAGSLLALLAYPLLVEPKLRLFDQSLYWSLGLAVLAGGVALCWAGHANRFTGSAAAAAEPGGPLSAAQRARWVGYSFVPSALLLAVTSHITTDLASAPLFWVVPLALYLLTFILAFARRPPLAHDLMVRLQPPLVIVTVLLFFVKGAIWLLPLHLALFFVTAMVGHGELARRRPPVRHLTEFYLWVSVGGVLGGVFVALLAPAIFPDIWEYPLMLVAACVVRPSGAPAGQNRWYADAAMPAGLALGLAAILLWSDLPGWVLPLLLVAAGTVLHSFSKRRWRFALGVGGCLLAFSMAAHGGTLETTRSFFGVHRVRLVDDGAVRLLQHGTTAHGAQGTQPGGETVPLAYYSREGPFGRFFEALGGRSLARVGVVGLGTGALVCYSRPGEAWTFHEIDPAVEKLATDGRYFQFWSACGKNPRIVIGDARLTLAEVPDGTYDALVIDAFSSDSIPLHLLTREALALYHKKLGPDGVILFHISNRYLDLAPLVAALARDSRSAARQLRLDPPAEAIVGQFAAEVVAVGKPGGQLSYLTDAAGWQTPDAAAEPVWTDMRSDLLSRIRWR